MSVRLNDCDLATGTARCQCDSSTTVGGGGEVITQEACTAKRTDCKTGCEGRGSYAKMNFCKVVGEQTSEMCACGMTNDQIGSLLNEGSAFKDFDLTGLENVEGKAEFSDLINSISSGGGSSSSSGG